MRIIKFRAWHKKWNFMFNINQIDWDKKLVWSEDMNVYSTHGGWDIKDGICCINHEKRTVRLGWCPDDFIEPLMQFTGLYDKNKKEIYEGDIVDVVCFYGKNKGLIKWSESQALFFIDGILTEETTEFICRNSNTCEIIGNIYENPELLKEPT